MSAPFFRIIFRLWSIRLALIGAFFVLLGTDLNLLVMRANGDMMPVATTPTEVFFVVGSNKYLEDIDSGEEDMDNRHRKMTSTDKLSYLSDRILIGPTNVSALTENICSKIGLDRLCPLSTSLRMASIGDLLIWMGIPFFCIAFFIALTKTILSFKQKKVSQS